MSIFRKILNSQYSIYLVVIFGFGMRLLVSMRGHNFDFDSYLIVAKIIDHGQNVYAYTSRYNYGPIWFYILCFLYNAAFKDVNAFRYLLVFFLSIVDFGIFAILWKKINKTVACIFFLNPISIIITGYHNQFDNIAIVTCMISIILIGDNLKSPLTWRKFCGLFLMGISLVIKHVFFAFPLWLAVKQKGLLQKGLILLIPFFIFLLSFLPYWDEGKFGIINNVFFYNSYGNEIFYNLFIPKSLNPIFSSKMIWIVSLVFFAFYFRQKDGFLSLLYYTCIVVITSPSIANQYLAIVVAFISV
jgi:hypothetical protein